jgi:hypothetical protein
MSDDPDFPKANHALQVLRQARLSRNDTAAIIVVEWNGSARVKVGGAPPPTPGGRDQSKSGSDPLSQARAAIAQGADPAAVKKRLLQLSIDPSGL